MKECVYVYKLTINYYEAYYLLNYYKKNDVYTEHTYTVINFIYKNNYIHINIYKYK